MNRFEKIFDYLLKVEGGYSDDKNDKGGKTKYGIIEEEARHYLYAIGLLIQEKMELKMHRLP